MRCTHADYVRYPCVRTTRSRTLAERLTVIMYSHAMCPRRLVSVERSGRLLHLKAWLVSYVSRQYIYVCMSDCLSFCLSVSLSHGLPVTVCASLSLGRVYIQRALVMLTLNPCGQAPGSNSRAGPSDFRRVAGFPSSLAFCLSMSPACECCKWIVPADSIGSLSPFLQIA